MITHIGTATMYVSDQEEARRFYCDVLGFSVVTDQAMGDDRWLEIAPPDGSTTIALHDAAKEGKQPGEGAYLTYACEDLAATIEGLRNRGAEVTDPDEQPWGTSAFIDGPDGHRVQVHKK